MEEEIGNDKSSSKEEDDKAWWSDYQASTKLKRKWVKDDKSDYDDFDDILGDLDDIVKKSDSVKDHDSDRNSRPSSSSGYETLTSSCVTPTPDHQGE